jgi:hypothetical protein
MIVAKEHQKGFEEGS